MIQTDKERMLSRVRINEDTGCWEWQDGKTSCGYGAFYIHQKQHLTHRFAYETFVGEIPDGLELDHLCKNRGCCNPAHLEAVTHRENLLRGPTLAARNAAKTHCPKGHEYKPENLIKKIGKKSNHRECRQCNLDRLKKLYHAKAESNPTFRANRNLRARVAYAAKIKQTKLN